MLCFLDDGAGMDPSKCWADCFFWGGSNHFYKMLIVLTCFSASLL